MNTKKQKTSIFVHFVNGINHFIRSFKNFFKSAVLSLIVIVIILLLLTQMDQALTMLVDMMETSKFSLLLCFFLINALALVLSHYPIYTYYAADLNDSRDYTNWHKTNPIPFWPFKKFPIFVFTTNPESNYKPDNWANYLRYSIGILIHCVWVHFIISSFSPNLLFDSFPFAPVKSVMYVLLLVPFVVYIFYKEKFTALKKTLDAKEGVASEKKHQKSLNIINKLYRKLGIWYVILALACFLLLALTLLVGNFSPGGFILLLLTSYALMFNYVFFRLLRTKLTLVYNAMGTSKAFVPFKFCIKNLLFLERSENYLVMYNLNFLVAFIIIVFSTIASIKDWSLLNGIPILLAFFYFYYFIVASLGKYFFVTKKLNLFGSQLYKGIFIVLGTVIALFIITFFAPIEVKTHQLDRVKNSKTEITEAVFIDSLRAKDDNTLFFIASHGGGLKANVWTLNVVNMLQKNTEGKLLNQTIALSGASGGSLGLALYTGLYKENGLDFEGIQKKIDHLAAQNYTSLDLSLTFGLDSYRKIWPFSQRFGLRDRPYYAMRKYQNEIQDINSTRLSKTSFRDYWKEAFNKNGYFPSLIMNTAGTQGSRGILWSVKQNNFEEIFPFAINLADLTNNETMPYYQAVSTTNRFPVFSPAAKIPGYGYFIDAGAIDNSGLLGCLDVHNYLARDKKVLGDKQIGYIEIINSKSLYIDHLIKKFKKQYYIDHIAINENETDNIIADLETGLNLDKIPGYLSDYVTRLEKTSDGSTRYFKIMMPHKVTFNDIEAHLKGFILSANIENTLKTFLSEENNLILSLTEKQNKSFFEPWEYYEPTLSRHLSKSSINYVKAILKHPILTEQFEEIESIINTKKIEENKAPQLSL